MIALGIFGVGLYGVVFMQLAASRGLQSSGNLSLASNLASSKLESFQFEDFDLLMDGEELYNHQGVLVQSNPFFTLRWQVTGFELKTIIVTATWEEKLAVGIRERRIRMRTRIAR